MVNRLEAGLWAWRASHTPEIIKGESGFNEQDEIYVIVIGA
jgi:hypothetical protein